MTQKHILLLLACPNKSLRVYGKKHINIHCPINTHLASDFSGKGYKVLRSYI